MSKIPVAILGATGAVGQRFMERLHEHPQFEIAALVASDRNAGKAYAEATNWLLDGEIPEAVADMQLTTLDRLQTSDAHICFSALPSSQAGEVERSLCAKGFHVFTNASSHRMDPDVPLLIPEVNPDHIALLGQQTAPGKLVANGNCSGIILTLSLAPLARAFGLEEIDVTTLQGLSGAGYPGISGMDIVDNVLPYIPGEEDKLETEPQKTLGGPRDAAGFTVRATCTRVPVREGHFEVVHARLSEPVDEAAVHEAFTTFRGGADMRGLHSAPDVPILVHDDPTRPQPRRDRDESDGMAIHVGRIRVEGDRVQYVVLGHNTVRGAAGQSVLNAEYAVAKGKI